MRSTINLKVQHAAITLLEHINHIILDKPHAVKLSLACILAGGHLLLQDLPGMGKTTLAHALAKGLGLDFNRIQFTNDMLPADILGITIYDQNSHKFHFRKGPVFTNLLLADEINRSSPKTQSALLEAMEEHQVTSDGKSYALDAPFFVIATQNPSQQSGVYPLPESQLDRFLMCISLGYPSKTAERELLTGLNRRALVEKMPKILSAEHIIQAQKEVRQLYVNDVVVDYIQALVETSRNSADFYGLSPRAVLALKHAACAHAYLSGQDNVATDDVQAVFAAVANHRLGQAFVPFNHNQAQRTKTLAERILQSVRAV